MSESTVRFGQVLVGEEFRLPGSPVVLRRTQGLSAKPVAHIGGHISDDLIQAERWNDQSQLTRLEEFLREHGLFAKLAEYAEAAAREEDSSHDLLGDRG